MDAYLRVRAGQGARMNLRLLPVAALVALSACSADNSLAKGEVDSALTTDYSDTGGLPGDSADAPQPAWFAPRAVVDVVSGVPALSQLSIAIVDADLQTQLCSIVVPAESGAVGVSPDPAAALWIDVQVPSSDTDCAPPPALLGLGIGELPGDVRAQLGPSGLGDAEGSLYGAYARAPNDDTEAVAAFGYAGTADNLAGQGSGALPPPDGQYVLNPLFLLRLPAGG